MSLKPAKVQFNGGELSPWLDGRTDIAKFDKTAKLCRNFIPMAEGSLKRRGGTRFVAQTPMDVDFDFRIETVPQEAKVLINGAERRWINVARGDKVSFEVSADGYSSQTGSMIVLQETSLKVCLVSKFAKATLIVTPRPRDAVVQIEGYERTSYVAQLNQYIWYKVSKNGYEPYYNTILMDGDKNITVTLNPQEEETGGVYGDWGVPLYFISCTVVGELTNQRKCFLFRFTNGYLAILFDNRLQAPSGNYDHYFWYINEDGYDSIAYASGHGPLELTRLSVGNGEIVYKDKFGYVLFAMESLTMMVTGWPVDEDGNYASIYRYYDGSILGTVGRVYYKGKMIWKLEGAY